MNAATERPSPCRPRPDGHRSDWGRVLTSRDSAAAVGTRNPMSMVVAEAVLDSLRDETLAEVPPR